MAAKHHRVRSVHVEKLGRDSYFMSYAKRGYLIGKNDAGKWSVHHAGRVRKVSNLAAAKKLVKSGDDLR